VATAVVEAVLVEDVVVTVEGVVVSAAEVVVTEVDEEELQEEADEVSLYTLPAVLCLPIRFFHLGQNSAFILAHSGAKSESNLADRRVRRSRRQRRRTW
jgi:hypothetical protein